MKEGAIAATDRAEPIVAEETMPKKGRGRILLFASVPLIILLVGLYFWMTSGRSASTDNAYVQQDMVSISSEVAGPIAEVAVKENQPVRKGDLLYRIDPRPYRIALAQAEASLAAARVSVNKLEAESAGTGADIQGATANLGFAQRAFSRQEELLGRGFTTRARYDEAQHAVQEARERLSNARANSEIKRAALSGGGSAAQPAVAAAIAARDKALLDLQRTEVHAPADGYVAQTDRLQVGNAAVPGLPLLSLVRSGNVWIDANFKETDLDRMAPGQPAEIRLDAYPGVKLSGHVASIGRGTGSEFSVLPAQNASGNWVKVTQRLTVRIAIDDKPDRPLLAGLSARVKVDISGQTAGAAPARR